MTEADGTDDTSSEPPPFQVGMARQLIGKRVLIGLTFVGTDWAERLEQEHGVVENATEDGFSIRMSDGETYWLPPDLRTWEPATPGEYRLRSTGEVVLNPDFITNWRVTSGGQPE